MALLAPGAGKVKMAYAGACLLDACCWATSGVLHQVFPEGGQVHDALWALALMSQVLGAVARPYAAQLAVTQLGKCTRCPEPGVVQLISGGIASLSMVLIGLAVFGHIPVADWLMAAEENILSMLAMA